SQGRSQATATQPQPGVGGVLGLIGSWISSRRVGLWPARTKEMVWLCFAQRKAVATMGIRVDCEQCGYKYHLKDELAGKKVKCKICRVTFTVPVGSPIIAHGPRTKDFEF